MDYLEIPLTEKAVVHLKALTFNNSDGHGQSEELDILHAQIPAP